MTRDKTTVPDIATLKRMAKAGIIELSADTGEEVRHWSGVLTKAYYVDGRADGKPENEPFEFKGEMFRLRYFEGCFKPFVCREGMPLPAFV